MDDNKEIEKVETPEVKTYSEDEVKSLLQKEADKRVTEALKKREEEFKIKLEQERFEAERLAKLSEEEKAKEMKQKFENDLRQREIEITKKEMALKVTSLLAEKNLPINMAKYLITTDENETLNNINEFEKQFSEALDKQVSQKFKGATPSGNGTNNPQTKSFGQLTSDERLKFKEENPSAYEIARAEFTKNII